MPDTIRALTYANHGGMLGFVIGARHGFVVIVASEPRMPNIPKSGAFQLLDASQKPRAAGITNLISVFTNC